MQTVQIDETIWINGEQIEMVCENGKRYIFFSDLSNPTQKFLYKSYLQQVGFMNFILKPDKEFDMAMYIFISSEGKYLFAPRGYSLTTEDFKKYNQDNLFLEKHCFKL